MNNNPKRRNIQDRRIAISNAAFPLRDRHGILVAKNRRVNADRRTKGLDVTESNLSKDEFKQYFAKYQNNKL